MEKYPLSPEDEKFCEVIANAAIRLANRGEDVRPLIKAVVESELVDAA